MKDFKRNLKSLKNKTGAEIIGQINTIICNHERYKGCYFWKNTGNASSRRSQEFQHEFSFMLDGKKYEVSQNLSISCKNFYFSTGVWVDGIKKNITAIKKLISA